MRFRKTPYGYRSVGTPRLRIYYGGLLVPFHDVPFIPDYERPWIGRIGRGWVEPGFKTRGPARRWARRWWLRLAFPTPWRELLRQRPRPPLLTVALRGDEGAFLAFLDWLEEAGTPVEGRDELLRRAREVGLFLAPRRPVRTDTTASTDSTGGGTGTEGTQQTREVA